MPKNLIFTDREALFLKALVKYKVPFMIVGLSAATLQGAPVVTQDIDLWFKDLTDVGLKRALKEVGGSYISPMGMHPPMLAGKNLEMFDLVLTMHGLEDFDHEIKHAIDVPFGSIEVKILPLERIIKSKEAVGREKDKLTLPVLKDALVTIRAKHRTRK